MRVSQTKLGHAIGVTFQQVQKYESGTNRVGASNLYRIAKALGVDVSFFFDGLPLDGDRMPQGAAMGFSAPPQEAFDMNPMSSRESIELMHSFYRIPDPQVRKRLIQLVRTLSATVEVD